jgi:hypothetical protein
MGSSASLARVHSPAALCRRRRFPEGRLRRGPPLSSDAFRDWLPPLSSAVRRRAQKAHVGLQIIPLSLYWSLAATHQRRANTRHLFVHVLSYLYSAHVHSSQANAIPVCTQTNSVVTVVRDLGWFHSRFAQYVAPTERSIISMRWRESCEAMCDFLFYPPSAYILPCCMVTMRAKCAVIMSVNWSL